MKDCDSPSSNDEQPLQHLVDDRCASNGGFVVSNGSAGISTDCTCRRRALSGDSARCHGVNGSFCHVSLNGHLTAPRVEQPPAQPVAPVADEAFPPAEHVGDGGGGGWTVPTRVQILQDLANLCTFAGAILATLAMACMWKGR